MVILSGFSYKKFYEIFIFFFNNWLNASTSFLHPDSHYIVSTLA